MATEYVEERESNWFLKGSRVSLDSVVYGFLDGESPETIQEHFPTLSLEQVYGAIAFYLSRREEIDTYLQAGWEAYEKARAAQQIPDELRKRLARARQDMAFRR